MLGQSDLVIHVHVHVVFKIIINLLFVSLLIFISMDLLGYYH